MKRATRVPIRRGNVIRRKVQVPSNIQLPPYAYDGYAPSVLTAPFAVFKLDGPEIRAIRNSAKYAAEGREFVASLVEVGTTTEEIDEKLTSFFLDRSVFPSPINYMGFPKSLCASVNEVMLHGIPDDRPLEDGDLVKLDVSCYVNGFHGDNCITVPCGTLDEQAQRLYNDSKKCFEKCIEMCGPGVPVREVGNFVSGWCEVNGYDTNRDFSGHGIGQLLHMRPLVMHCRNSDPTIMEPGMVFTIEPIISEGSAVSAEVWDDGWTYCTKDGSWATQFEHMVLITENGHEILTKV